MIDELQKDLLSGAPSIDPVSPSLLARLAETLRTKQELFRETGGAHAALLSDEEGRILSFAEDMGRHNALDKAIGVALMADTLAHARIGILSSRSSFEMVQKALRAGLSVLCGVSAPTSLAVDMARRFHLTLVGFLRGSEMTIYTGAERITARADDAVV